jgi:hypothetical protein
MVAKVYLRMQIRKSTTKFKLILICDPISQVYHISL